MTTRDALETFAIVVVVNVALDALWAVWPGPTYVGAGLLLAGCLALLWRSGRAA